VPNEEECSFSMPPRAEEGFVVWIKFFNLNLEILSHLVRMDQNDSDLTLMKFSNVFCPFRRKNVPLYSLHRTQYDNFPRLIREISEIRQLFQTGSFASGNPRDGAEIVAEPSNARTADR
jgi:hypothetical protein